MTEEVRALAKIQAEQLIEGAIEKLLALDHYESDDREDWLHEWWPAINQNAAFWSSIYLKSGLATGVALEIVNRRWPHDLPVEITTAYRDEDFKLWAGEVSNLQEETIGNLLRIARTFVLDWDSLPDSYKPKGPILIPERDQRGGEIVDVDPETGETLMVLKPVEFNPWEIDHSKLVVARSRINKGTATEALWEALADPKTTFEKTRLIVAGIEDSDFPEQNETKLYWIVSTLMAKENGVEVPLMRISTHTYQLYTSQKGTPAEQQIVKENLDQMLTAIGAPKP